MKRSLLFLFFMSFLFIVTAQPVDSVYQRAWATYFGGQGYLIYDVSTDTMQNILMAGVVMPERQSLANNANYYNQFGTETNSTYQFHPGHPSGFYSLIAKFSPEGELIKSVFIPYQLSSPIKINSKNQYIFTAREFLSDSTSQTTQGFWEPNSINDTLTHSNNFLICLSANLNILYKIKLGAYPVIEVELDENDNIYSYCKATPLQVGSSDSFEPNSSSDKIFLFKINSSGQFIWGTFYDCAGINSISYNKTFKTLAVIAGAATTSQASNYYISNGAMLDTPTELVMAAFNVADGSRNYGSFITPIFNKIVAYENGWYLKGSTDGSVGLNGLAIENSKYQENFTGYVGMTLLKLQNNNVPIWSTYICNNNYLLSSTGANKEIKVFNNEVTISGTTTNSLFFNSLAYDTTYNGGELDAFVMKFDTSGKQTWATYYGGSDLEYYTSISIPNDSTIYLGGTTTSRTNISTPNSYESDFSVMQVQIDSNYSIHGNGYLVRFNKKIDKKIDTVHIPPTIPIDSSIILLYPNPNIGNFTIKGIPLMKDDFKMVIYNLEGKRVVEQKLQRSPTLNFVFGHYLRPAVYFIKLENQTQTIKKVFKIIIE